jgi:cell division protease FtsH
MPDPGRGPETTRRLAAYHEAGHAVACFFCPKAGRTLRVSIRRSDLEAGDAGLHTCRPAASAEDLEQVRASAVVTLAGAEVDRRLMGDTLTSGEADYRAVHDLLFDAILDPEIAEAVASVTPEDARARGLEQIAAEKSAVIEAHRRRLFEALSREARELVAAKWRHVEAVAEALLEREALTGAEVDRIITRVERDARRAPAPHRARRRRAEARPWPPPDRTG